MSQHDIPHLEGHQRAERVGNYGPDAAEPNGVRAALDDLANHRFAARTLRPFRHHDDGEPAAALDPVEDSFGHGLVTEWNLRDQDDIASAGNSRFQGDPAGIAAHELENHDPVVRGSGRMQPVYGLGRDGEGRIEAQAEVRARHVVVDGLRDAGHANSLLSEPLCDRQAAVTANDDEGIDTVTRECRKDEIGPVDMCSRRRTFHGDAKRIIAVGRANPNGVVPEIV